MEIKFRHTVVGHKAATEYLKEQGEYERVLTEYNIDPDSMTICIAANAVWSVREEGEVLSK